MYVWGCTCSSFVLASGSQLGGLRGAGAAETSNTSYISPLTSLVLDCNGARLLQFHQSKAKVDLLAIASSIKFHFYISWKTKTMLYFYAHKAILRHHRKVQKGSASSSETEIFKITLKSTCSPICVYAACLVLTHKTWCRLQTKSTSLKVHRSLLK